MTYNQEFRCADSDKWQNKHNVTDKIPAHAGPVDRSAPERHPNLRNLAGSTLLEEQAILSLKEKW